MPFELARLGIKRNDTRCVEIVPRPCPAPIEIRGWVTSAIKDGIGLRVVGSSHPSPAASGTSGISTPAFGVVQQRFEGPNQLSGGRVEAVDLALISYVAARRAVGKHVAGDRRRRGEVAPRTLARVGQLRLPQLFAGILLERNGPSVNRANVNPPVRDSDAAAVRCEKDLIHDVVEFGIVVPEFLSSRCVERKYSIIRGDGVHHSVDH